MKNYIILNEDRWNNVNNDYTKPLTHEELQKLKNKPLCVGLTVGKIVPKEWFEKVNGKKILGLACGGGQQGPVFAIKGYDVTIMDFSKSQLEKDAMFASREGLKISTVQGDMTKPFPFENETFDIVFNPVSNAYIEDLENMYKEASRVLKKGGLLMVGFMNPWIYMYDADVVWDKPDEELLLKYSLPFNSRKLEEEGKIKINPEYGYEFSHTLESQIRGQLKNGLAMIDFYESNDKRNRLTQYVNDYIDTLKENS
nr:class I SAM-dependent methyltransferase [uncultured Fusobacterium sp.]